MTDAEKPEQQAADFFTNLAKAKTIETHLVEAIMKDAEKPKTATDAGDLVTRLNKEADAWDGPHTHTGPSISGMLREAAATIAALRSKVHDYEISVPFATIDALRREVEQIREALAGDDYASLPSDLPVVRMAHTIREDHDKFRNQVRDTCRRAEAAERELAACREDAERYRWLCDDLSTEEQRDERHRLCMRMGVMGKGAIDAAIKAARKV